jgi:formylglycine-generating enzyme required for sulfatase activity
MTSRSHHLYAVAALAVLAATYAAHGQRQQPRTSRALNVTTPLSLFQVRALKPKDTFKECEHCPEMVVVPAGEFVMGTPVSELEGATDERPQHKVTFPARFAVGRFAVTFEEWDACVADGGCNGYRPSDRGWGRGRQPAVNLSWYDAKSYVQWLSARTGATYRLLSEAEREYVARAGTTTAFWWGSAIEPHQANFSSAVPFADGERDAHIDRTVPVGSFAPNPWGLYDVHGNVYEWVEDCWNATYAEAPADGSAWTAGNCGARVLRGGAWNRPPSALRAGARLFAYPERRMTRIGLRIARTLQAEPTGNSSN